MEDQAKASARHGGGALAVLLGPGYGRRGSYGQLVAYAVMDAPQPSLISLQELSGAMALGDQGHDRFSVLEGCLVRCFLIDNPGEANAKATGGVRQICYKLKAGEAGWILRLSSVLLF